MFCNFFKIFFLLILFKKDIFSLCLGFESLKHIETSYRYLYFRIPQRKQLKVFPNNHLNYLKKHWSHGDIEEYFDFLPRGDYKALFKKIKSQRIAEISKKNTFTKLRKILKSYPFLREVHIRAPHSFLSVYALKFLKRLESFDFQLPSWNLRNHAFQYNLFTQLLERGLRVNQKLKVIHVSTAPSSLNAERVALITGDICDVLLKKKGIEKFSLNTLPSNFNYCKFSFPSTLKSLSLLSSLDVSFAVDFGEVQEGGRYHIMDLCSKIPSLRGLAFEVRKPLQIQGLSQFLSLKALTLRFYNKNIGEAISDDFWDPLTQQLNGCAQIQDLDLTFAGGPDPISCPTLAYAIGKCLHLKRLRLCIPCGFQEENKNLSLSFPKFKNLKELELVSIPFYQNLVEEISQCLSLKILIFSNFSQDITLDLLRLFGKLKDIEHLEISPFPTLFMTDFIENLEEISLIFEGCSKLRKFILPIVWHDEFNFPLDFRFQKGPFRGYHCGKGKVQITSKH